MLCASLAMAIGRVWRATCCCWQALSLRDAYEAEDDVDDAADDAELAQRDREALAATVEPVKAISSGQVCICQSRMRFGKAMLCTWQPLCLCVCLCQAQSCQSPPQA